MISLILKDNKLVCATVNVQHYVLLQNPFLIKLAFNLVTVKNTYRPTPLILKNICICKVVHQLIYIKYIHRQNKHITCICPDNFFI